MRQEIESLHDVDESGNPAGGHTRGIGIEIRWQRGPLGRGEEREEPNGAFVESVIAAAIDRLEFYQNSKFDCAENDVALDYLKLALKSLDARTAKREARGVEGTHQI